MLAQALGESGRLSEAAAAGSGIGKCHKINKVRDRVAGHVSMRQHKTASARRVLVPIRCCKACEVCLKGSAQCLLRRCSRQPA